jgi:hypothetical protein
LSKIKKDTGYNSNISLNEGITELLKKW